MDLEAADARFGVKTIDDMSWKDLLDGFTCTECGRCQEACPAWATGKPLNPKTMIMGIREMAVEAEAGVPLIPWIKPSVAPGGQAIAPVVDTAIPYDAVWDCVTCGACVEACPVMIEHVDKIVGLRRNLVLEESRFPEELTASFNNLERYSNIWGQPQSSRLDWARGLPFEVPTAASVVDSGGPDAVGRARVPVLGRLRRVVRRPQPPGRPGGRHLPERGRSSLRGARPGRVVHRRPGAPDGQRLRLPDARHGQCRDVLNRYKPKTIITACPHCFNTIGNEYGQLGGTYNVVHHSQFLSKLVGEGRLRVDDAAGKVDHAARLVLPDALQRRHLARRARCSAPCPGIELRRDGEVRPADVLLRRRWRPDVDGGEARHADQRRAHAPGARHRRRGRRHGVPVLPGDDARRRRRRRRPRGGRGGPGHRRDPRSGPAVWLAGVPSNGRSLPVVQ